MKTHYLVHSKMVAGGLKKYTLCGIEKIELNGQGNNLWVSRSTTGISCERCIKVAKEIANVETIQRLSA